MAVMVSIVVFAIDPARHDAFVAQMTVEAARTRGFDGCLGLTIAQAPGSEIVLIERWASAGHAERFMHWRQENGGLDALARFFVRRPVVQMFQEMAI
jgi:quinol monooxygenase YgiN